MNPKKASLIAVLSVMLIVMVPLLGVMLSSGPSAAETQETTAAENITLPGATVTITEKEVLPPVTLPPITAFVTLPPVTLPPIRLPGATVTLPGATVNVPGPRLPPVTVSVPGGTQTVTETVVAPQPTRTVFGPLNPGAVSTVTATETVTEPGQTATAYATVTTSPDVAKTNTETKTEKEKVTERILLGTVISLALAVLGLLALFLGYGLGQKDAQRNEDRFMNSLIDRIAMRGR